MFTLKENYVFIVISHFSEDDKVVKSVFGFSSETHNCYRIKEFPLTPSDDGDWLRLFKVYFFSRKGVILRDCFITLLGLVTHH